MRRMKQVWEQTLFLKLMVPAVDDALHETVLYGLLPGGIESHLSTEFQVSSVLLSLTTMHGEPHMVVSKIFRTFGFHATSAPWV